MIRLIKKAWALAREEREAEAESREKAKIAQAFNNRYTFRKVWDESKPMMPDEGMFGCHASGGYAWMCPECNKIHYPTGLSGISGLQYPRCCSTGAGHRLDEGIKY